MADGTIDYPNKNADGERKFVADLVGKNCPKCGNKAPGGVCRRCGPMPLWAMRGGKPFWEVRR